MQDLEKRYFDWLVETVSVHGSHLGKSYKKLLTYLYERSFNYYILPMDGNRSEDGIDLRYSGFGWSQNVPQYEIESYLHRRDCSMLEMMVALAIRAENIVGDTEFGDRTGMWFWSMVKSLGLMGMYDECYDEGIVIFTIDRFINHEYRPNGEGGLFTVKDAPHDMRDVEIWNQMCWFLSENA